MKTVSILDPGLSSDFYVCTVLSASIMQIIRWIIWSSNEKGMVSISVFGVAPSLISLEAFWQERFGRWPLFLGAPHSPLPSFVVPPLCFVLPVQFCVFHFLVFSGLYCLFTMQSEVCFKNIACVPTICIILTLYTEDVHNVFLCTYVQNLPDGYQKLWMTFDEYISAIFFHPQMYSPCWRNAQYTLCAHKPAL